MKKLIYATIALSFVITANNAQAAAACGASMTGDRNANTKYKVASLVKKPSSTKATVTTK